MRQVVTGRGPGSRSRWKGARAWGRKQRRPGVSGPPVGVRVWGEGEAWVGAGLPQGPGTPGLRVEVGGPERAEGQN